MYVGVTDIRGTGVTYMLKLFRTRWYCTLLVLISKYVRTIY